jgi:hypothetical protein
MASLTVRQKQKIRLAEHAETYIEYQQTQRHRRDGGVVRDHYDVDESRREWAKSFQ